MRQIKPTTLAFAFLGNAANEQICNRFGARMMYDANPGGGGGAETPEQFLQRVKDSVTNVMQERGFQTQENVSTLINKALEGLDLVQLRELKPEELNTTIRTLASEVEKIKNRATVEAAITPSERFMKQFQDRQADIQAIFTQQRGSITLFDRAPVVMTTGNVMAPGASGNVPQGALDSMRFEDFVPKRYAREFIDDIASVSTTSFTDDYVSWPEEGSTEGAFAIVAEGGLKPLVSKTLVRNWVRNQKVAGKYVVTEEFERFYARLLDIIQQLMRDQLYRDYSALVTAAMTAAAVPYTGTALDGTIATPNDYDAVAALIAQANALEFVPDVIAMNSTTSWRFRLTKDGEGRYIFPVVMANGETNIFGLRLVISNRIANDIVYVAESGLFKIERTNVIAKVGYGITVTNPTGTAVTDVQSDFDTNKRRFILEMFFRTWLPTNYAGSIVSDDLTTVKAALAVTP